MEKYAGTGWIEVICGPMFAGKSEELIRRVKRLEYAKKKTLVFKPKMDNRYAEDEIVSHSRLKTKSVNIEHSSDILKYLTDDIEAIVIDEVQFLDSGIVKLVDELASKGIRVICAGLDQDFRGEPFGIMPDLMARAEYITKLQAICQVCGDPATRTQRMIDGKPADYNDPIVVVGAKENYEARCRHCHQVPKNDK